MTIINSKTVARIAAVQFVYQTIISDKQDESQKIIQKLSSYYNNNEALEDLHSSDDSLKLKLNNKLFLGLCNQLIQNSDKIDLMITKYLSDDWKLENLHITLQAILRTGICEILFFPDSPPKVIVNEYTNIAADMLKTQEVGFMNSILDTITSEIRSDEN